jgi:hypothetical protein
MEVKLKNRLTDSPAHRNGQSGLAERRKRWPGRAYLQEETMKPARATDRGCDSRAGRRSIMAFPAAFPATFHNFLIPLVAALGAELWCSCALAEPVRSARAAAAVRGWLKTAGAPLAEPLGNRIKQVETFTDEAGDTLYHVGYLAPAGFVIVAADDLVEPIVGFVKRGRFDPSPDNPLGALVSHDLPGRVIKARRPGVAPTRAPWLGPRQKWQRLEQDDDRGGAEFGILSVPDVRVAPLVASRWAQTTVAYSACYNYYTPPSDTGDANNYPCGCVATALAQLLRYYQHPSSSVGTARFSITGDPGGHAVVCDGYGYSLSTLYHHLNLGWSGNDDAWYALPTIDTDLGPFTSIHKCVYNVFVTGSGMGLRSRAPLPAVTR